MTPSSPSPDAWFVDSVRFRTDPPVIRPLTSKLFEGEACDARGRALPVLSRSCEHFVINTVSPTRVRYLQARLIVDDLLRRELDGIARLEYDEVKAIRAFEYRVRAGDDLLDHPLGPRESENFVTPAFFRFARRFARPVPPGKYWAIRAPHDYDYPEEATELQRIAIQGYETRGLGACDVWYSPELLVREPCYYSQGFVCREEVFRVLRPHLIEPFFVCVPLHELAKDPANIVKQTRTEP